MRGILLLLVASWATALPAQARVRPLSLTGAVELHAHLFMEEGMSWMFRGDFFGPLQAKTWQDKLSSQANPESMERSGLRVVVASLYAHPLLTLSLRDSIRRQIALARKFVAENPKWVLATSPQHARSALSAGKSVLVLALEGASGIIETPDDVAEFVDRGGIRIVTLLHLTDDLFGGVALLKGWMAFASPLSVVRAFFKNTRDADGVRINDRGLTSQGRELALDLIRRGVWLDLAHASDKAQEELTTLLREQGQPVLYTHTILRRFHGAERGITGEQLQAVRETGGLVGVMAAHDLLEGTNAQAGFEALATQVSEIGRVVGPGGVALGTDFNGGVRHLPPAHGTGTSLDEKGLWQIGQGLDLWSSLERRLASGTASDPRLELTLERFLSAWNKAYRNPLAR